MRSKTNRISTYLGSLILFPWAAIAAAGPSIANPYHGVDSALSAFVSTVTETNPRVQAALAALDAGVALETARLYRSIRSRNA